MSAQNTFPTIVLGKRDDIYDPMTGAPSDASSDILVAGAIGGLIFYFSYTYLTAPLLGLSLSAGSIVLAVTGFFIAYWYFGKDGTLGQVKQRDVMTDAQQQIQDNGYRNEWRRFAQLSGIYSLA